MKTLQMVKAVLLVGVLVLCAGCMGMGGFESSGGLGIDASKMNADTIKASAALLQANKEKDTSMRCIRVPTPYGVGTVVELNMDTAGKMKGKATLAPDCTLSVETDSTAPPK